MLNCRMLCLILMAVCCVWGVRQSFFYDFFYWMVDEWSLVIYAKLAYPQVQDTGFKIIAKNTFLGINPVNFHVIAVQEQVWTIFVMKESSVHGDWVCLFFSQELGSQPLPTVGPEDQAMASQEPPRPRAGKYHHCLHPGYSGGGGGLTEKHLFRNCECVYWWLRFVQTKRIEVSMSLPSAGSVHCQCNVDAVSAIHSLRIFQTFFNIKCRKLRLIWNHSQKIT